MVAAMVIKKLARMPVELDTLNLFSRLDSEGPADTLINDPARVQKIMDQLAAGLKAALNRESTVHGWRAQSLFASLVVALDGCQLMTTIDHGEIWYDGEKVKPPDYMLVLRNGRRLLVEVKLVPPTHSFNRTVRLSRGELNGLKRFAALFDAELYIAVFMTPLSSWFLLPADSFEENGSRYEITIVDMIQFNEMVDLNDVHLGIEPEIKITLHVHDDGENKRLEILDTSVGGTTLMKRSEQQLARFLLTYGHWESAQETHQIDKVTTEHTFTAKPEPEAIAAGQGFVAVGVLSTMYSRVFVGKTTNDDGVVALGTQVEPGMLSALLDLDYSSTTLRLWRLHVSPKSRHTPPDEPDADEPEVPADKPIDV